jgi:hypothetical protein
MFHFAGYGSRLVWIPRHGTRHDSSRVSPFGYHRIKAYLPLPDAFRSLSRPSSPIDAKAFVVRPYQLDESVTKRMLIR